MWSRPNYIINYSLIPLTYLIFENNALPHRHICGIFVRVHKFRRDTNLPPAFAPIHEMFTQKTTNTGNRRRIVSRRFFWNHFHFVIFAAVFNPLNPELNSICYLLALLGAQPFLHVSRIRVKLLTFRRLMSYIYGAPILDVSRSHTTTQHGR